MAKTKPFDPASYLETEEDILYYLEAAMEGGAVMRVTVLGSGSAGNATLVDAGDVRILIDAGFSGREMERRMAAQQPG